MDVAESKSQSRKGKVTDETQIQGEATKADVFRLIGKWEIEMNHFWDEWQWCLDHKFTLEAQLKYELKEQLRRKINELSDTIRK